MGTFFTIKLPSRRRLVFNDDYPEQEEHEDPEEQEELEEEPMDEDAIIDPASESLALVEEPLFEVLPDLPNRRNDPHDERLAWNMGGDEMMKPTPSPGTPWTRSKSWMGDTSPSPESKSLQEKIAAIEHFVFKSWNVVSRLNVSTRFYLLLMSFDFLVEHLRQKLEERKVALMAKDIKTKWGASLLVAFHYKVELIANSSFVKSSYNRVWLHDHL